MLQYIPQFRGRVFVVLIEAGLLPESAVAETLLDLAALEDLGVKLVIGVLGGDFHDLYAWSVECEIKVALVKCLVHEPGAVEEAREILARGQTALVDASHSGPLDAAVVDFALGIGAAKVIALLDHAILIDGAPVHALRAADALDLSGKPDVDGAALLRAAAEACHRGVPRVHVLGGRKQGVLVEELFSNEGVGTMVHADSYCVIRRLGEEDIPELLGMIGRSVLRTRLLARTYEDIQARLADFRVMAIDDNVVGCVALHADADGKCAEVACLYVKQAHEGLGYGMELVRHAESMARERGIAKVFALTNRAADFFGGKLGYREAGLDALPADRREMYVASGRDSRVFVKDLSGTPE